MVNRAARHPETILGAMKETAEWICRRYPLGDTTEMERLYTLLDEMKESLIQERINESRGQFNKEQGTA